MSSVFEFFFFALSRAARAFAVSSDAQLAALIVGEDDKDASFFPTHCSFRSVFV